MADIEALSKAQVQLAAIERNADLLLAALSSPGTRPLGEAAAILVDTAAVLSEVKGAEASVEAALAAAAASGGDEAAVAPRVIGALWRLQQQNNIPLGQLGAPAQDLPTLVAAINALPGISVSLLEGRHPAPRPSAASMLLMLCGPSVVAVQLAEPGGLLPLRTAFFAPGEEAGPCWPWAQSQHLLFRRASEVAAAALAHFNVSCNSCGSGEEAAEQAAGAVGDLGQGVEASALEMLLLWLATYSDLFSRPCSATGTLLAAGGQDGALLPPVYRPYRLSWRQLRAAAADPAQRCVFHSPLGEEGGDGGEQQAGDHMES